MMRLSSALFLALSLNFVLGVGQPRFANAQVPGQRQVPAQRQATGQTAGQTAAPAAPFAPLNAQQQQQLQQVLMNWQNQSQSTKTLQLSFLRFHYDGLAAPANVPANKADGTIRYQAPDKGEIKVDQIVFFAGMNQKQPAFKSFPDKFGEHWVCNGKELIEFDRNAKEQRIQVLPPEMQGRNIISSPLPFVFNLNAAQLQQRYWVRQAQAPNPSIVLLEIWPKRAEDRSQYKMVQVALDANNYLPKALVMYAPNFDVKLAPVWDHYEFRDVKRNAIGNGMTAWFNQFIQQAVPADWKILRDTYVPSREEVIRQADAANRQQGQAPSQR